MTNKPDRRAAERNPEPVAEPRPSEPPKCSCVLIQEHPTKKDSTQCPLHQHDCKYCGKRHADCCTKSCVNLAAAPVPVLRSPKWEIAAGPIIDLEEDRVGNPQFVAVRYAIRYESGEFQVIQRVANNRDGFREAWERVQQIIGPAAPLRSEELLSFLYTNYKGQTAERLVEPIRIYFGTTQYYPKPQWLLEAFDLDKQEVRTFSLNAALASRSSSERK